MRRSDREITDEKKIAEILDTAKILHLGMVDGDRPYVLPLHYGYEFRDGALVFYMHGAKEGRKLEILRASPASGIRTSTAAVRIWRPSTSSRKPTPPRTRTTPAS